MYKSRFFHPKKFFEIFWLEFPTGLFKIFFLMKTSRFIHQLVQFLTEIIVSIKQLPYPVIKQFLISIQKWIYRYVIHVLFIKERIFEKTCRESQPKNFKKFFWMEKPRFIHQLMQFLTEITKIGVKFHLIEKILKKF